MISKVVCVAALVALVCGDLYGNDHYGRGQYGHGYADDYAQPIDYQFKYLVSDDKTYNYQTRDEVKDGKTVHGSYSLVEPDGSTRIVKYTADEYGFHAQVENDKAPAYGNDYKPDYKPAYKPSHDYKPSYDYKPYPYQPSYDQKPSYPHQSAYPVHSYAPKGY
uniref:Uncharacterized protein n=1 Tax=Strigamia maritima TaxID=126957 RepID=T1J919_STRMM